MPASAKTLFFAFLLLFSSFAFAAAVVYDLRDVKMEPAAYHSQSLTSTSIFDLNYATGAGLNVAQVEIFDVSGALMFVRVPPVSYGIGQTYTPPSPPAEQVLNLYSSAIFRNDMNALPKGSYYARIKLYKGVAPPAGLEDTKDVYFTVLAPKNPVVGVPELPVFAVLLIALSIAFIAQQRQPQN